MDVVLLSRRRLRDRLVSRVRGRTGVVAPASGLKVTRKQFPPILFKNKSLKISFLKFSIKKKFFLMLPPATWREVPTWPPLILVQIILVSQHWFESLMMKCALRAAHVAPDARPTVYENLLRLWWLYLRINIYKEVILYRLLCAFCRCAKWRLLARG